MKVLIYNYISSSMTDNIVRTTCYNCNCNLLFYTTNYEDKSYFCQQCSSVEYSMSPINFNTNNKKRCSSCYDDSRVLKTFICCSKTGKVISVINNTNS